MIADKVSLVSHAQHKLRILPDEIGQNKEGGRSRMCFQHIEYLCDISVFISRVKREINRLVALASEVKTAVSVRQGASVHDRRLFTRRARLEEPSVFRRAYLYTQKQRAKKNHSRFFQSFHFLISFRRYYLLLEINL